MTTINKLAQYYYSTDPKGAIMETRMHIPTFVPCHIILGFVTILYVDTCFYVSFRLFFYLRILFHCITFLIFVLANIYLLTYLLTSNNKLFGINHHWSELILYIQYEGIINIFIAKNFKKCSVTYRTIWIVNMNDGVN